MRKIIEHFSLDLEEMDLWGSVHWFESDKIWKLFNASNCGDNCAKWILSLGEEQDFTINLFHVMNFGKDPFSIRILNSKNMVAHDMQEFLNDEFNRFGKNSGVAVSCDREMIALSGDDWENVIEKNPGTIIESET